MAIIPAVNFNKFETYVMALESQTAMEQRTRQKTTMVVFAGRYYAIEKLPNTGINNEFENYL